MMTNELLKTRDIYTFLNYGYVPTPKKINVQGLFKRYNICASRHVPTCTNSLVSEGCALLNEVFADIFTPEFHEPVFIPLSGGLDSRTILAATTRTRSPDLVKTITVGVPGAMDFEIAKNVAHSAGVEHTQVNLNEIEWDESALIAFARGFSRPISLVEGYLHSYAYRSVKEGSTILTGFLGDPLAGSRLPATASPSWTAALENFSRKNHVPTKLRNPIFRQSSAHSLFPHTPYIEPCSMTFDDQLDFFMRQRHYIRPLVLWGPYRHITPFLHPRWISFWLAVPLEFRRDRELFCKIVSKFDPKLFALPVKGNFGLPLNSSKLLIQFQRLFCAIRRHTSLLRSLLPVAFLPHNYIDLNYAFRTNRALKFLTAKNLEDFDRRQMLPEIVALNLWEAHLSGSANWAAAISLFLSLEIFLKAHAHE